VYWPRERLRVFFNQIAGMKKGTKMTDLFDASKRKFCSLGAMMLAFAGISKTAMAGETAKPAGDQKKPQDELESLKHEISRINDVFAIERLQARYEAIHSSDEGMAWMLFANRPDTSQEITYARAVGFENIKKHYVESTSTAACKSGRYCFPAEWVASVPAEIKSYLDLAAQGHKFTVHPVATPCIVVAGDGKTAKATFTSLGFEGNMWCYGKYANDYIKIDGEWYIWHQKWLRCFETPFGTSWADQSMEGIYQFTLGKKDANGKRVMPPGVNYDYLLASDKEFKSIPVPQPYETWTDAELDWWKKKIEKP
jgi:hypothetical protein